MQHNVLDDIRSVSYTSKFFTLVRYPIPGADNSIKRTCSIKRYPTSVLHRSPLSFDSQTTLTRQRRTRRYTVRYRINVSQFSFDTPNPSQQHCFARPEMAKGEAFSWEIGWSGGTCTTDMENRAREGGNETPYFTGPSGTSISKSPETKKYLKKKLTCSTMYSLMEVTSLWHPFSSPAPQPM